MKRWIGNNIIFLVVLLVCILLISGIISTNLNQQQKEREIEAYRLLIQQYEDENAAMREIIDSGDISEYAGDIARNKLNYGQNNEKVYVNITGK